MPSALPQRQILMPTYLIYLGTLTDSEKPENSPRKKSANRIQKRIDFTRGGSFRQSVFPPIVSYVGQMTHLEQTP